MCALCCPVAFPWTLPRPSPRRSARLPQTNAVMDAERATVAHAPFYQAYSNGLETAFFSLIAQRVERRRQKNGTTVPIEQS